MKDGGSAWRMMGARACFQGEIIQGLFSVCFDCLLQQLCGKNLRRREWVEVTQEKGGKVG
jgi:hypothetical protein